MDLKDPGFSGLYRFVWDAETNPADQDVWSLQTQEPCLSQDGLDTRLCRCLSLLSYI